MSFVAHLMAGVLLALAYLVADVAFTEGQGEFLVSVGYVAPTLALGMIWLKNYSLGAPIFVLSTISTSWYACYFFFLHDNPAGAFTATGEGSTAYAAAAVAVVVVSFTTSLVGCWLWYRESEGFRAVVDGLIQPS